MLLIRINNKIETFRKYEVVKDMVLFYQDMDDKGKRLTCAVLKAEMVFLHGFQNFLNEALTITPVAYALSAIDDIVFPKKPEDWLNEALVQDFVTPCRLQLEKKFWLKMKALLVAEIPGRFDYEKVESPNDVHEA